jgi:hypothetical protein
MANPCPPSTQHHLVPEGTRSNLKFSSGQIGLLKQMAWESRPGFSVSRLGNKVQIFQGTLALFRIHAAREKTMAADLVARELGLSVYRVNFNQVMRKLIGETEKNMVRVLKAAEMKKMVVLLNEADALV